MFICYILRLMDSFCSYPFVGKEDYVGSGTGCVLKAKPHSSTPADFKQDSLECISLDWSECDAPEYEFEEVLSNVISLTSKAGNFAFEVCYMSIVQGVGIYICKMFSYTVPDNLCSRVRTCTFHY